MSGVAEEAAEFKRDMSPFEGFGRFRRFADGTPLFEVLEIRGERADIRFLEGGEFANVRLSDVRHSIQAN